MATSTRSFRRNFHGSTSASLAETINVFIVVFFGSSRSGARAESTKANQRKTLGQSRERGLYVLWLSVVCSVCSQNGPTWFHSSLLTVLFCLRYASPCSFSSALLQISKRRGQMLLKAPGSLRSWDLANVLLSAQVPGQKLVEFSLLFFCLSSGFSDNAKNIWTPPPSYYVLTKSTF